MRRTLPFFAQTLRGAPSRMSAPRQSLLVGSRSPNAFPSAIAKQNFAAFSTTLSLKAKIPPTKVLPVEKIENEMLTMINEDLKSLEEDTELNALNELKEQYIKAGTQFEETDEKVTLKRNVNGRTVSISWDPREFNENTDVEAQPEEPVNETDSISEVRRSRSSKEDEKEWDDGEAEEGDDQFVDENDTEEPVDRTENDINVKIEVTHEGKTLYAVSVVADDSLLYIYQMGTNTEKLVEVELLSEPLQHKLYDYLSELGVGDRTAQFIRKYNASFRVQKNLENLRVFKEFFD
eukprot:TRINITY_DN7177_c0_g1_i1.p1 TRINITY_DN7177_c0_g1~~TRINITY_DN7177_c0_g1_i1.p1  ORF type:complete len:326 (+),score=157.50 TRINITY_DN7177_c0_g1_i1:104-979(+)